MNQNILINNLIKVKNKENEMVKNIFLVISGVFFIALMSQVRIPLPFTVVPITGQTFAVMLIGLTYGKKLGVSTLLSYITAGIIGFPVFAGFTSGFPFNSASGGFIIGFLFAAYICGYFADKGWTKSYSKLILVLFLAHFILYLFGLIQLSLFFPTKNVFIIGLVPFIPGDVIKMILMIGIFPTAWKFIKK
ncbi:biotin transporter BioY [Leptotrichia sp. OH3620_COT-345]|uniref:biotin transporter BioY n=1 Tax=Leptotrichia sp. OH3620_COT-345 TaxID=2491048 RepID=UPI000F64E61E|nr:biotin transporter BioY [Leptotrichia sp. OH3620_COT-345]RRD37929.1 biotin transporter BioY [Leptotrichia sp. OH3620_COT-345]